MKANQERFRAVHALRYEMQGIIALTAPLAPAATVWSGTLTNFSKLAFAGPTQATNQDRLTGNGWPMSASTAGLYNAKTEAGCGGVGSPADPENTASKTTT